MKRITTRKDPTHFRQACRDAPEFHKRGSQSIALALYPCLQVLRKLLNERRLDNAYCLLRGFEEGNGFESPTDLLPFILQLVAEPACIQLEGLMKKSDENERRAT